LKASTFVVTLKLRW